MSWICAASLANEVAIGVLLSSPSGSPNTCETQAKRPNVRDRRAMSSTRTARLRETPGSQGDVFGARLRVHLALGRRDPRVSEKRLSLRRP
jgi:hypothetical protein